MQPAGAALALLGKQICEKQLLNGILGEWDTCKAPSTFLRLLVFSLLKATLK